VKNILLLALVLVFGTIASDIQGAGRAVNSSGLGVTTINTAILCDPGDSIEMGFGLASPSTQNWCTQACALVTTKGGSCTAVNNAVSGTASWEWVGGAGGPLGFVPPAPTAGKTNVALIALGSNNFTLFNSNNGGLWFSGQVFPALGTGHIQGLLGSATVTVGNPTIMTFSYTLNGRSTSDWIECLNTGLGPIDNVPLHPSAVGSNTLSFAVTTSGTPTMARCFLNSDSTVQNYAVFRANVGGTTGTNPPAWSLSAPVTDGTVTWGYINPSNLVTQFTADLETDITSLADSFNSAWHISVATVIPRSSGGLIPMTPALIDSQRTIFTAWALGTIGTHKIKTVVRFDQSADWGGLSTAPTACSVFPSMWQGDCVHPSLAGATDMATFGATAIIGAQ
jgi:hypothetical protein